MKKVLLIEDDLIDQMAFTRMFDRQDWNYQYAIANSIKQAKEELNQNQYDLVISDHNLADGTALDLLKHLKNIPFILITGNEDDSTIGAVIKNSHAAANFTKDLNFNYLKELPIVIKKVLLNNSIRSTSTNDSNQKTQIIQKENVTINLDQTYKIFGGKKEDVKEVIEIFIHQKPQEINDLYNFLNARDCEKVTKVSHRIKSGFRLFGMAKQEELADIIEKTIGNSNGKCLCPSAASAFKQLSTDTKLAIELLKKELPLL